MENGVVRHAISDHDPIFCTVLVANFEPSAAYINDASQNEVNRMRTLNDLMAGLHIQKDNFGMGNTNTWKPIKKGRQQMMRHSYNISMPGNS